MRIRKKPDLTIKIPSYPSDYVEMPDYTKRLILSANRMENDLKYVDDEDEVPNTSEIKFQVGSPNSLQVKIDYDRAPTPEVKITEPQEDTELENSNNIVQESHKYNNDIKEDAKSPDSIRSSYSPIILRRILSRTSDVPSLSPVDKLNDNEIKILRELYLQHFNVSEKIYY